VLGVLGSGAGLALAGLLIQWFRAANPIELPPGADLSIDWHVLLFSAVCGIVSSIIFALFPAWRGMRVDPNAALKSSAPSVAAASLRVPPRYFLAGRIPGRPVHGASRGHGPGLGKPLEAHQ
jgi:hypothetical protein